MEGEVTVPAVFVCDARRLASLNSRPSDEVLPLHHAAHGPPPLGGGGIGLADVLGRNVVIGDVDEHDLYGVAVR